MIIFASSVKHAAVNFLQWEYGCFAPVCPSTMRGKIPNESQRGKITKSMIIDSLPDPEICTRFAAITFVLTEFSKDEVFLLTKEKEGGKYDDCSSVKLPKNLPLMSSKLGILPPRWLFTEEDVTVAFKKFRRAMHEIEDKITIRNNDLKIPYEVLLPSRVPVTIAI